MPTVTVKGVAVSGAGFNMTIESDLIVGGAPLSFGVRIDRDEWAGWKTDNPAGTMDDFILLKVQTSYNLLTKVAAKANAMVGKTLTW